MHLLRAAHRWDGHDIPSRLLVFAGDLPIRDEPLPRFLDDAAVTTLLQAARSDADPFVRLTVEFLARTGLRKGEFLDLTIDSVVLIGSAYWLHVPLGKLRTDRYIPLHPATGRPARHLARHPPQHSPSHCLLLKDGHRIAQNRGRPRRRQGRPHRRRRPRHPSENDPGLMSSDPVMPERCQRLSTMRTLGHQEQCGARRFWSLGQQVRLYQPWDVDIQRHPAFLVAVAHDPDPTSGMSTSRTCRPSTSADRRPENSISPAIARPRSVRTLPSNAAVSARSKPRGSRRDSRTRNLDRDFGRSTCASNLALCAVVDRRAAAIPG